MSNTVPPKEVSLSGLTETEAKEFHKLFVVSFIVFTLIAIVAHFLVWQWRPWIPGPHGYATSMLLPHAHGVLMQLSSQFV
jgi:light-harvesting complex 1 beta chain